MQEFLVAEQFFTSSLRKDVMEVAVKGHTCGKPIIECFRILLSDTAHTHEQLDDLSQKFSKNVAAYDDLAETMVCILINVRSCLYHFPILQEAIVLQFWTNDQHK